MKQITIIIEQHRDGYVAYPVGIKGVVIRNGRKEPCCFRAEF